MIAKSQKDYLVLRKGDRGLCKDRKVILSEKLTSQVFSDGIVIYQVIVKITCINTRGWRPHKSNLWRYKIDQLVEDFITQMALLSIQILFN